ncbi:MAG TPA: hypothetical protein VHE59_16975 [Mucilaginibacter sp.]|nr:hypothetical protein [Mucilaginibacter sp.]
MTEDEKIILHSLKFIKRATKYSAYVNILNTLWKDWEDDKQEHFRELLWDGKYIQLNTYQWEFQITTKGKNFINEFDKKLEDALVEYLKSNRDIRGFMIDNFVEPNPFSPDTINSTDDGVIFLKKLKREKRINYDDGVLNQINTDWIPVGDRRQMRWYNTMSGAFIVTPLNLSKAVLHSRLSNSQSVLKQVKYAIKITWKYLLRLFVAVWKYLVALSLVYLGIGDHFKNTVDWIKHFFK